jgi:O-antigen/teichoic acid export membrane protein
MTTQPTLLEPTIRSTSDVDRTLSQQSLRNWLAGNTDRARMQRDAAFAFLIRVTSAALLYLSQIVLARWMGPSEYGVYVLVWTWVLVLGGLSHLGLSMAMIRLLPEYSATGQLKLLRGLLHGGRLLTLCVGTAIALLGGIGLFLFGHMLEPYTLLPAYLALICVPIYALTDIQDGIGRGHGWMGVGLAPPYILRPLVLLLGMIILHALEWPMTAATAAGAAIAATWLACLLQTLLMRQRLSVEHAIGARTYDFKAWLRISAPLLIIYAAELVIQNADVILLSLYRPPSEVGMYFAGAKTMALVMFVHYAIGSAYAHRFSSLKAQGDNDGLKAAVRDAVRWTFWPSLVAAMAILALGKPLLSLFSQDFVSAYPVMVILVLGFLARASVGPAEFMLNMLGEQNLCAAVVATAAVLNIILNVLLIPRLGLLGAACATSAALVFTAVANFLVARRRLGLNISILQHLRARNTQPSA